MDGRAADRAVADQLSLQLAAHDSADVRLAFMAALVAHAEGPAGSRLDDACRAALGCPAVVLAVVLTASQSNGPAVRHLPCTAANGRADAAVQTASARHVLLIMVTEGRELLLPWLPAIAVLHERLPGKQARARLCTARC